MNKINFSYIMGTYNTNSHENKHPERSSFDLKKLEVISDQDQAITPTRASARKVLGEEKHLPSKPWSGIYKPEEVKRFGV